VNSQTKTALAAGIIALFGLAPTAHAAPVDEYAGTRADARTLCETDGGDVFEGLNFTLCVTETSELMCFDHGFCAASERTLNEGIRESLATARQN
jgi:hypothetical protein